MTNVKNNKIIVGMSGGVDSSVAAYLLKKEGYEVEGVYLQVWSNKDYLGDCPWEEDIEIAARVAKKLDIPFRSLHVEEEYKLKVVEYMVNGYREGITPNPDIMCNREIKFGVFLDWALEQGADYIATGHYCRKFQITNDKLQMNTKSKMSKYKLLKGKDANKDQSYFLHALNQKKLSKILFPIGEYEKPKIREMGKYAGLPNWDRKDSQGICFIGKVELPRFLKEYIKPKKGQVITTEGKELGEHNGIYYYTIGQRHGLDLGDTTGDETYYIVEKRLEDNVIVVAKGKDNPALLSKELTCTNMNWISVAPELPFECTAKIRYRQKDQKCSIVKVESRISNLESRMKREENKNMYRVIFNDPQWAVAPGQSIVFYKKDECLGGGIIVKSKCQ